ncbi:LacI family DNA-binding transcriptional regulator [Microbacterium sp. NPDC087868]|uniref:LacI family DNA-binding transcriptional regulator n=1 Tax=Microbacterium sp. NPDC087868 TaxID=3364195 RepID=UPI00384E9844
MTVAASIRDVADRAGVSVGTVSNVLNHVDRVKEDSVRRVHEAIAELGYVRNDAARQLRAGHSLMVGLVVLDVRNPFFTELARGAEREAARHGLSVVLANSDEDVAQEARHIDLFEQQRVRGILLSPYQEAGPRLRRMRDRGIPAVLVDRRGADDSFSSVSVDDETGGYLAARHLLDTGRRRILFAGGPLDMRQVEDRLGGARRAIAEVPGAVLDTLPSAASTVDAGRLAGDQVAALAASERPDAIFCANDLVALGVLQGLLTNGIRVPQDVALIGFDDIDFAAAAAVPLSSVRQPSNLMGETAMRLLLESADDPGRAPEHIVFQSELVARASTA